MNELIVIYLVVINIIAIIAVAHDKHAAIKHKWRIPENTLLLIAALSGCIVMYIAMHIFHHKTRKKKFMIGIPVIFIAEVSTVLLTCYLSGIFH